MTGYDDAEARHNEYAHWDAAYVLGALSPAERHEFEAHRAECERCAAAVADLAALPGLLSALPAGEAETLLGEADDADSAAHSTVGPMPTDLLSRVAAVVRRRRRRVRGFTIGVIGLLAGAAAVGLVLPVVTAAPPAPTPVVAASLQEVTQSPLEASVRMTGAAWGTRIEVSCHYGTGVDTGLSTQPGRAGTYGDGSNGRYALDVTDAAGTTTRVATWTAGPGDVVDAAGSIATPVHNIASVELRSLENDSVLLSHSFE